MKKFFIVSAAMYLNVSAYAMTDSQFENCPKPIKKEVEDVVEMISQLEDDHPKMPEDLLDIISFSISGIIRAAPTCEYLNGFKDKYVEAFKYFSKL